MDKTLRDQLDKYRRALHERITAVELLLEVEDPQLSLPLTYETPLRRKKKKQQEPQTTGELGRDKRGRRRVTHRNGHRTWVMKVKDYIVKHPGRTYASLDLAKSIAGPDHYDAVRNAVLTLHKDGFLKRVKRGVYQKKRA